MKTALPVAFQAKKPLQIVEIDLEASEAGEILIEIMATDVSNTDAYRSTAWTVRFHNVSGRTAANLE